jgi:hypothetical protein
MNASAPTLRCAIGAILSPAPDGPDPVSYRAQI